MHPLSTEALVAWGMLTTAGLAGGVMVAIGMFEDLAAIIRAASNRTPTGEVPIAARKTTGAGATNFAAALMSVPEHPMPPAADWRRIARQARHRGARKLRSRLSLDLI